MELINSALQESNFLETEAGISFREIQRVKEWSLYDLNLDDHMRVT